jgi:probable rRNA maturation factor
MARAARKTRNALSIDVVVESKLWNRKKGVKPAARRAIVKAADVLSTPSSELAIVLTDDSTIRLLNRDWRGIDAPTNVLSFPANRAGGAIPFTREARAEHKPFAHHIAHLAVHGFLHLLGYDHVRKKDAEEMEQLERDILCRLRIPDPYRRMASV